MMPYPDDEDLWDRLDEDEAELRAHTGDAMSEPEQSYWAKKREEAKQRRKQKEQEAEREAQYRRLKAQRDAINLLAEEDASEARALLEDASQVTSGDEFLFDVPPLPPAIWGKGEDILWARGEALMIAGPQGVGKTTLAGHLLRACVLGGDVLGLPVEPCNRGVLYLAMDRPQQARRNLSRMFSADKDGRGYLGEMLRFWSGPPPTDLSATQDSLLHLARRYDADVIFVDSLKDAVVGLTDDKTAAAYNRARQRALNEGVQIVELHHTVKNGQDGKKPDHINGIYGSTWLTAGLGSVVLLWGEPGDPIVDFRQLKQPMNEVGPFRIIHNRETGLAEVWHDPETDLVGLARRGGVDGLTLQAAAEAMFSTSKPSRAQMEKARRRLGVLCTAGLLSEMAGTRGRGHAARWVAAGVDWPEPEADRQW